MPFLDFFLFINFSKHLYKLRFEQIAMANFDLSLSSTKQTKSRCTAIGALGIFVAFTSSDVTPFIVAPRFCDLKNCSHCSTTFFRNSNLLYFISIPPTQPRKSRSNHLPNLQVCSHKRFLW